jgi:hypothetical protein
MTADPRKTSRRPPRVAPVGPQGPPALRSASLMGALRSARVPPMDYVDDPLPPQSLSPFLCLNKGVHPN